MPQEHFVLRCFSCETFQAHIVKKTKKWECKMCGAKQSVKRNYGKGSGKDCRIQVMKLNELRLQNECAFNEAEAGISDELPLPELKVQSDPNKSYPSKWEKYLEAPAADSESELDNGVNDLEVEEKREKKKRVIKTPDNYSNKSKKVCWESNVDEASPAVTSYWLSPARSQKNFEGRNTKEKYLEKNRPVQSKNKLKPSKYAVYMDDDDDDNNNDDDGGGGGGGDVKVNKNDVPTNKCLNVFDSEPCDLDKILSLE